MSDWKEELSGLLNENQLFFNEPMRLHTTFRIGGSAEVLVYPNTVDELITIIRFAKERDLFWAVIGNGSNLLVSDDGLCGIVISTLHLMREAPVFQADNVLTVSAGILLSKLAQHASRCNLGGLSFAHGIPGTLGAAVVINAGAYGGEMKDVVTAVTYLDGDGAVKKIQKDELDFSYRHSCFSNTKKVVLSAELTLHPCPFETTDAEMKELAQRRREKQPLELPSAGSAFKRPTNGYAAQLIESCGLKGLRVGDAQVSVKHAGFIVNLGNATALEVRTLMEKVQTCVAEKTGVRLEPEICFLENK